MRIEPTRREAPLERCLGLLPGICLLVGVCRFFWLPVLILGDSMLPTFHSGDMVVMRKHGQGEPRRFDVVTARTKQGLVTKRIIGLPGENVAMENGLVLVNGEPLQEPHIQARGTWTIKGGRLPTNDYLLIGDNRELSESVVFIADEKAIVATLHRSFTIPWARLWKRPADGRAGME